MRRIYDYLFYSIYRNTVIVNKSIPDWSTIGTISLLLALNIFSFLIYSEFDIESIGRNGFAAIIMILIGLNYLYFIRKKRYEIILNKFKSQKNKFFWDMLVLIYACASIFVCFEIIGMRLSYTLFLIGFVFFSSVLIYLFKKSD